MLFKIFKVDETSKSTAYKVAVGNLVLTLLLTAVLVGFIAFVFNTYEEVTADHVSRLIWVEIVMNFLFYPFAIILTIGVKKDKLKWINIWIKAKVVQASYIFLLNLVVQVYITTSLNVGDGLIVLVYTLLVEVFYLENIMYMNNYYRHRLAEGKNLDVEAVIPNSMVLKF